MVTKELIDYIKTQKQQNVTDEIIKESLLKSNWLIEDINQAFFQINISSVPQAQTTVPSQPVTSFSNNDLLTEEKPKIIKTVSIFIFLIAFLYIITTMSLLGIIVIWERSMGKGDLIVPFLKYFPTFGLIPIMFSFVSLFFLYLAFKIRNGSRFSLWLGISSLLVVPILIAFFSQILMSSFTKLATYNNFNKSISSLPLNSNNFNFGDPIFILAAISVVLIFISFKKFHFNNDKISNKAKVFLVIVFVILIVPTISIISLYYIKAQDTDYGFTKMKTAVNYHVYKPGLIPNGLIYATKFTFGKELAGKQNAIRVTYDIPFDELIRRGKTRPTIINQVGVETGFNLEAFAKTFVKDAKPQKIMLSKAVNQIGYFIQNKFGNFTQNTIVYLTNDNVLIVLTSLNGTFEELIQFAESLE